MEKYDIIIIGAGPGGLTAGIYAGRQGTDTLIIDRGLAGGIGREVRKTILDLKVFPVWN